MSYIEAVKMAKEQGLYDEWLAERGLSRAPVKAPRRRRKRKTKRQVLQELGVEGMGLV